MKRLRRMLISFCVVLNLASFGLLFLVLANGSTLEDVVLIASDDAILLWRGSLRTRRLEAELREEALYPPE